MEPKLLRSLAETKIRPIPYQEGVEIHAAVDVGCPHFEVVRFEHQMAHLTLCRPDGPCRVAADRVFPLDDLPVLTARWIIERRGLERRLARQEPK
jgi:hypothetical protein